MGKAHSIALKAMGAVFNTGLRPAYETICTSTWAGAAPKREYREFTLWTCKGDRT